MSPILEAYIQGDKGGFLELIEVIAAHTDNRPAIQVGQQRKDRHSQDVRTVAQKAKAVDVIQTRKGYVRFIF